MAIQRDDTDERQARLDAMIEQIRAEKRALLARGIALWRQTEAERRILRHGAMPPPEQIN